MGGLDKLKKKDKHKMIELMFRHKSHYLVFDGGKNRYASGMGNCMGIHSCMEDAVNSLQFIELTDLWDTDESELPCVHILEIDNSVDGTQSLIVHWYTDEGKRLETKLLSDMIGEE